MILDNHRESAVLCFYQENEFKDINLLYLDFKESNVDTIKDAISFRINASQQLNMLIQERIKDITKIIEQKNPTLMKEIKRGIQMGSAEVGQKISVN